MLSQARFHSVRRRFFQEIRNPQHNSATIISIIEGMTFVRVKMFPVEELEQWFAFLQECANYFLDCSREKIKQAMAALLVGRSLALLTMEMNSISCTVQMLYKFMPSPLPPPILFPLYLPPFLLLSLPPSSPSLSPPCFPSCRNSPPCSWSHQSGS